MIGYACFCVYLLILAVRDIKYKEIEDILILIGIIISGFSYKDQLVDSALVFSSVFSFFYLGVMSINNIAYYFRLAIGYSQNAARKIIFPLGEADMLLFGLGAIYFLGRDGNLNYNGLLEFIFISFMTFFVFNFLAILVKKTFKEIAFIPFILIGFSISWYMNIGL